MGPGLEPLVPPLALIAVLAMLMVHAMVELSRAVLTSRQSGRATAPSRSPAVSPVVSPVGRWGATYVLSWLGLAAAFSWLLSRLEDGWSPHNLRLAIAITVAWLLTHGALLWFLLALTSGRAPGAERSPGEPDAAFDDARLDNAPDDARLDGRRERGVAAPRASLWHRVPALARAFALAGVAVLVVALVELVPGVGRLDAHFAAHQRAYLLPLGGAAALGFVLFMGGIVHLVLTSGRAARRGAVVQAQDAASFAEVKRAWHARAWRTSRRWRRLFILLAGVALLTVGLFGCAIVLAPAGLKLICAAALAYAVIRTALAFRGSQAP